MNAWIEQYLRPWTSIHPNQWAPLLPIAEYAHNSWKHEGTQRTPHELITGSRPQVNIKLIDENVPSALHRLTELENMRKMAQLHMEHIQQRRDDNKHIKYREGDLVWLETRNLSIKGNKKLSPKRTGPFKITKKISSVAFQLDLPSNIRIHNVFHADLLLPYKETEAYGPPLTRPPPIIEQSEEEYEIESIIDAMSRVRPYVYLVFLFFCSSPRLCLSVTAFPVTRTT